MKLSPSPFIWFNGELVPWDQAQVHVLTHALHYGSSVFEGLRAYASARGTSVLGLDLHVHRLFESCKTIHLPLRWTEEQMCDAIRATVRANKESAGPETGEYGNCSSRLGNRPLRRSPFSNVNLYSTKWLGPGAGAKKR